MVSCILYTCRQHGRRDYYDMRYAIRYGSRECDTRCEYVMGRANAICDMRYANAICDMLIRYGARVCDMRIRYELRECDMRYANRLRAICEYAMGRAYTICCDTRIGYARDIRMRYEPREYGMRYANRLRAMSNLCI